MSDCESEFGYAAVEIPSHTPSEMESLSDYSDRVTTDEGEASSILDAIEDYESDTSALLAGGSSHGSLPPLAAVSDSSVWSSSEESLDDLLSSEQEIQTRLSSIVGNVPHGAVGHEEADDETVDEYVNGALASCHEIESLVKDKITYWDATTQRGLMKANACLRVCLATVWLARHHRFLVVVDAEDDLSDSSDSDSKIHTSTYPNSEFDDSECSLPVGSFGCHNLSIFADELAEIEFAAELDEGAKEGLWSTLLDSGTTKHVSPDLSIFNTHPRPSTPRHFRAANQGPRILGQYSEVSRAVSRGERERWRPVRGTKRNG